MDRYAGKPFLRLLDSYFLDVIGQLGEAQNAALVAMQPRLAAVYRDQGSWQEIVARQMDFPPGVTDRVQMFWRSYQEVCQIDRLQPDALAFVESFVSQNFPDI
ncbi:hypothetical protein LJR118_003033 [Acidovorax sp. LjRoot118]|jgi:hypothetical protein|uniref:hypothetical protein n=1 Tax=unclassified Acidovorax TaxID=2684926 RepID=UPI00070F4B6D|nr:MULTISPECIES: hypothetical protein [unclassified Acidovorax]KRC20397.1 hypothetical protein ASE31_25825 [Acidovorax sp. Root217]KRC22688.1 hypothetical protein ASE28_25905 [Acidovorax sp. Root219]